MPGIPGVKAAESAPRIVAYPAEEEHKYAKRITEEIATLVVVPI
jgi:hypothetical protein